MAKHVSHPDAAITFTRVTRQFDRHIAVENLTLEITAGTFVSIVGPSGCGKSTVLNMAAGLMAPTTGKVSIFGESLAGLNRRATYLFQQDALLPWKTVLDNVTLGLAFRGRSASEKREAGLQWLERVGLGAFADHFPHQLSGGMRKRVGMAQNWIVDPDMLLMDEPFSALDVHTRRRMESELLRVWTGTGKTIFLVTHDLEEAIALSDEVVVLSAGPASTIVGRYSVELARPRDLIDIRTDPGFLELYRSIWSDLRTEVLRSYGS